MGWRNDSKPADCRVSLRRNVRPAFSSTPASGWCEPSETSVCFEVHFKAFRLGGLTAHRSPLSRRLAAIKQKTPRTSHISAVSPSHLLSHSCFTTAALSTTGIPPPSAGKSVAPKHSQPISELRTIVNFGNFPTAHGCGFSETVLLQKFPKLTERYEPGFQCRVPAEVTAVVHRSSSDPGVLVVRLQPSHGTRSVSFHPF